MIRRSWILIAVLALVGCSGEQGAQSPAPPVFELPEIDTEIIPQIAGKIQGAQVALRQGKLDTAIEYYQVAVELAPEAAMTHYFLAFGLATQEKEHEALAALEMAVERGYGDFGAIEAQPQFVGLVCLPEWPALRERIVANNARYRPDGLVSYRRLDPRMEPEFDTLAELSAHYDGQLEPVSQLMMIHPNEALMPQVWTVLNHKLAGLARFLGQDVAESDIMPARHEILKTVGSYEKAHITPWLPATVELTQERVAQFIDENPDQVNACAQAAYLRARAIWLGQAPPKGEPISDEMLAEAARIYGEVDTEFTGTLGALMSLMESVDVIFTNRSLSDPQLAPIIERIQTNYAAHPVMQQIGPRLQPFILAKNGLPEFAVRDIDGREFSTTELGERVVLIDFWATWCAPCRAEVPNLVSLYEEYEDQGFEIIGISLDDSKKMSTDRIRKWTEEQGMTWPIVFEGKGWDTASARACGVTAIPFPILVGRDGKILTAGQGATGAQLRKALVDVFGS